MWKRISAFKRENLRHRAGHALPLLGFVFQLAAASAGETVELGLTIVVGGAPFGGDPAGGFEPLQRRIERALVHAQHVVGDLLNALRDAPAVL